jgi:transposase
MHRLQELVRLHRMDTGPREVARLLRMSPNTERKYRVALEKASLLAGDPEDLPTQEALRAAVLEHTPPLPAPQQVSSVEPWRDGILTMIKRGAGPRAIYDRLRLEHDDFTASPSAVKRFCRRHREEQGVRPEDVAIPVDTALGEVCQVDFGYLGKLYDPAEGRLRKAWAFVAVLGHSRHMFARIVFDQKTTTWLELHVALFNELGGVPEVLVPDNLKAAVIRAAFAVDGTTTLNRSYRELARHYGFKIDPTPPRSPQKKGKVESGVKYVRRNFFQPRLPEDIHHARRELDLWLKEIAGERIHGSTGRRPREVFEEEEREALRPLPRVPYERVEWKQAKVHRDCHVVFEKRQYSAPWRLVGQEVWIQATGSTVTIHADEVRVATHDRRGPGRRSTIDAHLPDHRSDYRHRSRTYWEARADRLGEVPGHYIREIFASDDVLSQLRTVQAVVRHLESFPLTRACAACERALHYGNFTYGGLKRILREGLDLIPLPDARSAHGALENPRYARRPAEILPLFGGAS